SMWTVINPLGSGDAYKVTSLSSVANVAQLRNAGTNYPAAIRQRYVQLPNSLPDRVRQLARQIVSDARATNPFDVASALEFYLRTQIKYNEKIPAPPSGTDGVDYVLFDVKEGYCDYYAAAMAVMARSLGIPARIATGYTQGTFDATRGVYQVFQFNAHTWAEVYFPQYGWVQFEPTASQPSIDRPRPVVANAGGTDPNADLKPTEPAPQTPDSQTRDTDLESLRDQRNLNPGGLTPNSTGDLLTWMLIIGSALVVIAIGSIGAMWLYENRSGQRQASGGEWVFARLSRLARWLRVKLMPWQTPFEQAKALSQIMPASQPAFEKVASLYVQERYGRTPADRADAQTIWRGLRPALWWTGFKRRLPRSLPRRSWRKISRRNKSVEP
ncbi:MAG TPA: transglutaminase domain-containing protein, partial [Anaerolineae bacterium]|nr:transglutaminase domain-containing protein [Anaerolineae bacterium]